MEKEKKTAEEILAPFIYENIEGFGDGVTVDGALSAMEEYKNQFKPPPEAIPPHIAIQIRSGIENAASDIEAANEYAERVCSGEFPITYSRKQVVRHTADDFLEGAKHVRSQSKQQWVDVKVRRPEIGVIVNLILRHSKDIDDVYSGFRANGGWYVFQIGEQSKYYIPNGIEEAQIIKWQPLPSVPIEFEGKKK